MTESHHIQPFCRDAEDKTRENAKGRNRRSRKQGWLESQTLASFPHSPPTGKAFLWHRYTRPQNSRTPIPMSSIRLDGYMTSEIPWYTAGAQTASTRIKYPLQRQPEEYGHVSVGAKCNLIIDEDRDGGHCIYARFFSRKAA